MGVVYVAEHSLIGRRVALKLIAPELARHPDTLALFFQEARAANQIAHPNIVQITDLVEANDDHPPFMVMELLDGYTLGDVLEQEVRLPALRVADVGAQIADAMAAAHTAGVIHRDLKPDNVVLCNRSNQVKVLDFGLAHLRSHRRASTDSGLHACGTPLYMSPEQAGADEFDERTDIYSLGAILYEALAGQPLFDHDEPRELMLAQISDLPTRIDTVTELTTVVERQLSTLIMRCLEKSPESRPQTMTEVGRTLKTLVTRLESPAQRTSLEE